MTLSTPVKVIALAGLALILGAGGLLVLSSHHASSPAAVPPAHRAAVPAKVVHISAPTRPVVHHAAAKPRLVLDQDLPAPVAKKLRLSREVVAFVYTGASISDRALLTQVRTGAHAAGIPFVPLNVTDESTAVAVHGWAATSADPVTLVVKRPGKIVFQLQGPTDSQAIAQAAASAR
jgi:hypothetical protein